MTNSLPNSIFSGLFFLALLSIFAVLTASAAQAGDSVGVVDGDTGMWYLHEATTAETTSFYFGNPGDDPFVGDWDCDGVDTPGLYRRSDGYVYLRNSNSQGIADLKYYFGNPGDAPVVGDFDGDGCDTVSLYRPSEQRFYIINRLGSEDQGLGAADFDFAFGNHGDKPFSGDFDGNGTTDVGLHRESSGRVYFRTSLSTGVADADFIFGNPNDAIIAGDWDQKPPDGSDSVGIFRRGNGKFFLRFSNTLGTADADFIFGNHKMSPVAGDFGALAGGDAAPELAIHLVSQFTTYHSCCEPRVTNIHIMADAVDGMVVAPGEVFDLNERLGPRTTAKGYVPAPILLDGQGYCCDHPLNIGGGTSQFGTTIYASVFWSGLEEISHRPHSRYINRYPLGIEATLGYPSPNVVFRNDTEFPVTIRTGHTSTALTVEIWGNNHLRTIKGSHRSGRTSMWLSNYGDIMARRVSGSVSGSATYNDGGRVVIRRTITAPGSTTSKTWVHTYRGE